MSKPRFFWSNYKKKRGIHMRSSQHYDRYTHPNSRLMGLNLHRFIEVEQLADNYEIASEFGLSLKEVKQLKEKIARG